MFQIWGQVADVMQVVMVAVLFVMQLGIYCFFGEQLIHQVRYWQPSIKRVLRFCLQHMITKIFLPY